MASEIITSIIYILIMSVVADIFKSTTKLFCTTIKTLNVIIKFKFRLKQLQLAMRD